MTRIAILILAVVSLTRPVWAQPAQGAMVSGSAGATAFDSNTSVAFSASAGYRFNSVFGLNIELTSVPSLELESPYNFSPLVRGAIGIADQDGSLTVFTANVRLEVPTTARRIVPYAAAGGGVANLKQSFEIDYNLPRPAQSSLQDLFGGSLYPETVAIFPILPPIPQPVSYSSVAMALTLGGGLSVLATEHLSVDVDLRYLRLSGDTDHDLGRFGVGASYRF